MQVNCIKCGAALDGDFGMVKCSSCGEILLVDLMGEVLPATTSITNRKDLEEKVAVQERLEKTQAKTQTKNQTLKNLKDLSPEDSLDSKVEISDRSAQPEEAEVSAAEEVDAPLEEGVWTYDAGLDSEEGRPENSPIESKTKAAPKRAPEDMRELADFANSEVSSAREGPFLYRIRVEGIITKEIRESIGAALSDRHFGWDPNRLLAEVRKGVLVIENVNPAKASVLIKRLKGLRLEISWEQVGIAQADLI